jgi:L-ascorbate metabolism protein UlaG (beta-lactamase superfamily)
MKKIPLIVFLPLLALFALFGSCALHTPSFDEDTWRSRVKSADPALLYQPHFKDNRFFNPWMPGEEKGFFQLLRWKLAPTQEYTEEERTYLPGLVEKAKERILARPHGDFVMWVGHATFLLRVNGVYWLVDPIFSKRALLPKRKTPPGIALEDLKEIAPDLRVIITHNHYDHLDKRTLLDLSESTKVYVPLGLKTYIQSLNKKDVTEMDWWQEMDCGGDIRLVCLPVQHWSRRMGQGWNETLWASFMLITSKVKIYLGGDSGYFIGYDEIGKRFPGIDYALLPTTAFHPRWFMHYNHMNIDETIEAFNDLNARFMIPTQWGTFHLGDEPPGYPALELKRKIAGHGLDPARFIIMDIGEIHAIPSKAS